MSTAVGPLRPLLLAEPREIPLLADFLGRLLRYDRAAAVRLQTAGETLAVFARIPLGQSGPLVIRTALLDGAQPLDVTVSAGQWLEELGRAEDAGHEGLVLPPAITGPAWAGLLPPRVGWERVEELDTAPLAGAVAAAISEFRKAATAPSGGDALAEGIWSRQVHPSGLTLRALHAAHLTGLLQQAPRVTLHRHSAWLRLTAPRGSVVVRRASAPGAGLGLTPNR